MARTRNLPFHVTDARTSLRLPVFGTTGVATEFRGGGGADAGPPSLACQLNDVARCGGETAVKAMLQQLRASTLPWDESLLLALSSDVASLPIWRWAVDAGCPWTSDAPCRAFEDALTAACSRCRFSTDPNAREMYDCFHARSNLYITWPGDPDDYEGGGEDPHGGIRFFMPDNYAADPAYTTRARQIEVLRAVGSLDAVVEHRAWLAAHPGGCPCSGTLHAPPASVEVAPTTADKPFHLNIILRQYRSLSEPNPLSSDAEPEDIRFAIDAEPSDTFDRLCERIATSGHTTAPTSRLIVFVWGPPVHDYKVDTLAKAYVTDGSLIGVCVEEEEEEKEAAAASAGAKRGSAPTTGGVKYFEFKRERSE